MKSEEEVINYFIDKRYDDLFIYGEDLDKLDILICEIIDIENLIDLLKFLEKFDKVIEFLDEIRINLENKKSKLV